MGQSAPVVLHPEKAPPVVLYSAQPTEAGPLGPCPCGARAAKSKRENSGLLEKKKKKKGRIFESVLFLFLINPNVCVRERSSASCFCSTAFRRLGSRRLLLPTFHLFLGVWSILITSCQRWLKDEFDEFYPHCNENLEASTGCVDR